ncbi:MAG: methyltransferase [Candidatus Woesebacteria bacterium]|jgi:ubiquinone/menaquinone biosynthesis C-methylase UbiE
MQKKTILKINQLNQDFYQKIAQDFNDSRGYYWQGWYKLKKMLCQKAKEKKELTVLDLGCGNARLAGFLVKELKIKNLNYIGIDNNDYFLKIAKDKLKKLKFKHQLLKIDLMKTLINQSLKQKLKKLNIKNVDFIFVLGLIHHLPCFKTRSKFVLNIASLLDKNEKKSAKIILAAWQLINDPRFKNKIINPDKVGISSTELEKNDYIIDWRRGKTAYRYYHYFNQNELNQILSDGKLKLTNKFFADGKSGKLNQYFILEKNKSLVIKKFTPR